MFERAAVEAAIIRFSARAACAAAWSAHFNESGAPSDRQLLQTGNKRFPG